MKSSQKGYNTRYTCDASLISYRKYFDFKNNLLPSGCRDQFALFFSEQSLLTNKLQANQFHNAHSTAQSQVRAFRRNSSSQ